MKFKENRSKYILILILILVFSIQACENDEVFQPVEPFPTTLSNTGIFVGKLPDLIPADEYTFYELSSELFSDYAEKQRLIKLPTGEELVQVDGGLPLFPNGTSLVKTFYYWNDKSDTSKGKKILETRLLVRQSNDWIVGVYKWNVEQTEAYLLSGGNDEAVNWINENGEPMQTTYHIPSTKECITCHQSDGVFKPIGPKLFNLNRPVQRNGATVNQLTYFQQKGLINAFHVSSIDSLPNYNDKSLSDDVRARAYMEVNCSHCHTSKGFAPDWLDFDFAYATPLDETAMVANKAQIIEAIESGKMPFIGTSILDREGVQLVTEYLKTL